MNTTFITRHGSVERKKDRLVKDLKGVVADADELLKAVSGSTAEEFATARAKIEARLSEAISRLDDARISATDRVQDAAEATQEYVREHPLKVVGVAGVVAAGLILGYLLSRR